MNNVNNIAENKASVNSKKEQKSYKIIATLYNDYCLGGKRPFYKDGNKWVADSSRDIAARTGIPYQTVNKKLNSLKRDNLIEYDYVNEFGYGKRKYVKEPKKFRFTPKAIKLLVKPLSESLNPREEKKGDTVTKETNKNNYLNKLTSGEVVFKKHNDSKGALVFNLLLKMGISVPIEQQTFCFIVKLCSILAQGLSTEIAIQRLREYINWLIFRLKSVKYDDVFNFKNVYKFYFVARKRWQAEEREARLLEEHAERRLLDDRKREYQWLPSSKAMNSIGNVMQNLMEKLSPPRLAVSMRMLQ